jgi:hypothetical protein
VLEAEAEQLAVLRSKADQSLKQKVRSRLRSTINDQKIRLSSYELFQRSSLLEEGNSSAIQ